MEIAQAHALVMPCHHYSPVRRQSLMSSASSATVQTPAGPTGFARSGNAHSLNGSCSMNPTCVASAAEAFKLLRAAHPHARIVREEVTRYADDGAWKKHN